MGIIADLSYVGPLAAFFVLSPQRPEQRITPKPIPTPHRTPTYNTVINVSNCHKITEEHLKLLSRGLSFIPTSTRFPDIRKSLAGYLQQYHRRLKLFSHFRSTNSKNPPPFYIKSTWEPRNQSLPQELLDLIRKDQKDLAGSHIRQELPNLTPREDKKLQELISLSPLSSNQQTKVQQ